MRVSVKRGAAIIAFLLAGCAGDPGSDAGVGLEQGWGLMLAKEYPAARDHYEGMLVEFPTNPYVHLNLGVAYQRLGNRDLARQHYEAAIAYGAEAEVTRVVKEGEVAPSVTTVADQARDNLLTLSG